MIYWRVASRSWYLEAQLVEAQLQIREYKNLLNRRSGSTGVESEADYNAAAS
jgi:hypothetical protein